MALTTPILGIQYPQLADSPNAPYAFGTVADAIDTKIFPRFTSTAARDAAIPSPVTGQACVLIISPTNQGLQLYRKGAWSYVRQNEYAYKTTDTTRTSTVTKTDDPNLTAVFAGPGVYIGEFFGLYTSAAAAGGFAWSTAYTGTYSAAAECAVTPALASTNPAAGLVKMNNNANIGSALVAPTFASGAVGVVRHFFYIVTTTGGTFSIKWAQNASSANGTALYGGSTLRYMRI